MTKGGWILGTPKSWHTHSDLGKNERYFHQSFHSFWRIKHQPLDPSKKKMKAQFFRWNEVMKYESVALAQKADYTLPRGAENSLNLAARAACHVWHLRGMKDPKTLGGLVKYFQGSILTDLPDISYTDKTSAHDPTKYTQ